jgi:hypothetical protein
MVVIRRLSLRRSLLVAFGFLPFLSAISAVAGLAQTARAAQAASDISAPATLQGELEIIHQDNFVKHKSRYLYFLKTPTGRIRLHFNSHPPTNLMTGDWVQVRGTGGNGTLTLKSDADITNLSGTANAPAASVAPLPNTLGAQKTAVLLIIFRMILPLSRFTPA